MWCATEAALILAVKTSPWTTARFVSDAWLPRLQYSLKLTALKYFARSASWPRSQDVNLTETPEGWRRPFWHHQTVALECNPSSALGQEVKWHETRRAVLWPSCLFTITWVASCQSNLGSHWHACGHRAVEIRVFNWTINLSAIGWRQSRECNGFIFIMGP